MVGDLPADFQYSDTGKPQLAPERFKSSGEIREVCNQMRTADARRSAWRAQIDGLIDGNPAYSLGNLRAKGQSWRARVNYREAEGLIQQRMSPFYDLVTEVNPCIEVCLDYANGDEAVEIGNKIARNFHWMFLKRWRSSFNFHIPLQQREMFVHGIGAHVWPGSKYNWIPRTPITGMLLFPDGVSVNVKEDLDYCMLRDFVPGFVLYQAIKNEAAATALGWNIDAVWSALLQSSKIQARSSVGENTFTLEMLQREFKSGDIGTTVSRQSGIWLNHLFVKEIDSNKIAQYTIAEGSTNIMPIRRGKDAAFNDCLFRKRERFDDWPLNLFPYDLGSGGKLHTVRGLGARTKDFFELANRITNAMADQVLVGATMLLKQTGTVDPDKLRLARLSVMSILPQGLEIAQGAQFPPLAQGPIAFSDLLTRKMQNNNEAYMQEVPEPVDRETGQSFQMRMQNAGQMGKGAHSNYASNYQQVLERIFNIVRQPRAALGNSLSAKLAKEFQDRCVKDNIPQEALDSVYEINEVLSTGAGSAAARLDALMTVWKLIYPTAPEPKKINLERDITAAVMSSAKVDRYARSQTDNQTPDQNASFATLENSVLAAGGEAEAASEQDHVEHAGIHLPKAQQIAASAMQGQADPAQVLAMLQGFGQHIAEHLKFLATNPFRKPEYEALNKQFLDLSIIADKLQQQVEAAAAAQPQQPPQQQESDNLRIGMAKIATQSQLGQQKLAANTQLALRKIAMQSRVDMVKASLQARNGAGAKTA